MKKEDETTSQTTEEFDSDSKTTDDSLDSKTKALKEREKELDCIYQLSEIIEDKNLSPDETLLSILNLIPPAFQYPEITCARLIIKNRQIATDNFKESPWKLSKDVINKQTKLGTLEVYYLEERPKEYRGPFLKQELKLLDVIIERLGAYIQQTYLEQEILQQGNHKGKPDWQIILDMLVKTDPRILFRVTRKMLYHLSRNQNESLIGLMMNMSCPVGSDAKPSEWCGINMPNPKQDLAALNNIQENVFKIAEESLPPYRAGKPPA